MAVQLLPLLAAGGRLAGQYLPAALGGMSFLEGMKTGGLPGALAAGGLSYFGAKKGLPMLPGLQAKGAKAAPGLMSAAGIEATPLQAKQLGAAAVPLALATVGAPLVSRLAGQVGGGITNLVAAPFQGLMGGAGNLAQSGAGILGYRPDGSPIYGGQAVPGGMGQYGPTDPYGSPLDVLGPTGMGRRLETVKSAEAQRDAMRMLLPEVYKATEATKKSDFERQAAMKGIAQNIATRAAMLQNAQAAGLQMGGTAAQQAGQALTQQYQYQ